MVFDVMEPDMLTGRGWRSLRQTVPGVRPFLEHDVILAGARDLEPYQRRRLERSGVVWIPGPVDPARFEQAAADPAARVRRVYLHVDLDSLDVDEAKAEKCAAGNGVTLDRPIECIRVVRAWLEVAAAAITADDPEYDADDRPRRRPVPRPAKSPAPPPAPPPRRVPRRYELLTEGARHQLSLPM